MIRKGLDSDIYEILKLTKACAKHLMGNDIYQWSEFYPNATIFTKDIKRGELYVLEIDKTIIGCIVISTLIDDEYIPVEWLTPNKNNVYIHRLAIHPDFQGNGYAQILMDFAEKIAIEKKYSSLRLDTFSKNKRNQIFYELRGYKKLEEIYFRNQSEFPFYCYELVL